MIWQMNNHDIRSAQPGSQNAVFLSEALLNSRKIRKNIVVMTDRHHVSGGEHGEK